MAYTLINEVVSYLGQDDNELTPAERLVLMLVADRAHQQAREAWSGGTAEWDLRKLSGLTARGLRDVLQRLAERGLELRVARGEDAKGRPLYAHRGVQTTYRLPALPEKGGTEVPPLDEKGDAQVPPLVAEEGGTQVPPIEKGGTPAPKGGTQVPQGGTQVPLSGTQVPPYPSVLHVREDVKDKDGSQREALAASSADLTPETDPKAWLRSQGFMGGSRASDKWSKFKRPGTGAA